jgi:hypothetical protein
MLMIQDKISLRFFKFFSPFHHFTPLKKALKKSVLQTNLYSEVKFRKNVYKQFQTILFAKNLMYVVEENRVFQSDESGRS